MQLTWSVFAIVSLITRISGAPNFVFVLTDDQDLVLNSLVYMKKTLNLVASQGITFTNAFVNSPVCCPSRSSILTGKLASNLQVYNNSVAGGCSSRKFQERFENSTIASVLKSSSYKTFYGGKYLNQYGVKSVGSTAHVPPGYDWWIGLKGNSKYYNYTLSINGTKRFFSDFYLTDKIRDYALEFLKTIRGKGDNFFMMLSPPAAHAPFTPPPRYKRKFPKVETPRNAAFNFTPIDKHWLVQMPPKVLPSNVGILDSIYGNRLRTLLAVDDMVEAIVDLLRDLRLLDETYIILTSDNGFHIGQFTQPWDKRQPYETDIRVPFLMRGPGIPRKSISDYPVSAIDFAPTILDLAGIQKTDSDGESFKEILLNPSPTKVYNQNILIEYWGEANSKTVDPRCRLEKDGGLSECSLESWCKCQDSRNNTYSCVLSLSNDFKFKYCRFVDGFTEAYNLSDDPSELVNIAKCLTEEETGRFERALSKKMKFL